MGTAHCPQLEVKLLHKKCSLRSCWEIVETHLLAIEPPQETKVVSNSTAPRLAVSRPFGLPEHRPRSSKPLQQATAKLMFTRPPFPSLHALLLYAQATEPNRQRVAAYHSAADESLRLPRCAARGTPGLVVFYLGVWGIFGIITKVVC